MTRTSSPPAPPGPVTARRGPALALAVLVALLGAAGAALLPPDPLPGEAARAAALAEVRAALPELSAREEAFHSALAPWSYGSLGVGLLVAALLGLTPAGARTLTALARPLRGGWRTQVVLGVLLVTLAERLARLPLSIGAERVLREYGLSAQTWGTWSQDVGKAVLLNAGVTALVLLALVGLARRSPQRWWAWGAGLAAALTVAGSFLYPLAVEPLFNRFTALPAGPLRTELLALAERDGVPVQDVLVADASRRTTALNAYVSGFGATRRIVVYDTLLERAEDEQVALVVAHELGHAQDRDVLVGTALGAVGAAAGVCLLALVLSWAPLLRRAGASGPGDPRAVPLVLLLATTGTLAAAPAVNAFSRRVEARADLHALELTGDTSTFVAAQLRLAATNLSDLEPHPVAAFFFASHPSTPQRIALARAVAAEDPAS